MRRLAPARSAISSMRAASRPLAANSCIAACRMRARVAAALRRLIAFGRPLDLTADRGAKARRYVLGRLLSDAVLMLKAHTRDAVFTLLHFVRSSNSAN